MRIRILILLLVLTITGTLRSCKLISEVCDRGERISATVKCDLTFYNFGSVVQRMCGNYGHYSYYDYYDRSSHNGDKDFDLFIKLLYLNYDYMRWNVIMKYDTHIKEITIDEKGYFMKSVPTELYSFTNLSSVVIVETGIVNISLTKFAKMLNLKELNASHNSIAILEEGNIILTTPSRLITIDLSHNIISTIPDNCFSHFTQLKYLNLSFNSLSNFDILSFEGLSLLQTLDLSYNKLLQIGHTLAKLVNLEELSLAHNNLDEIAESNFKTMSHLQKLNISANKLTNMADESFQSLSSLMELDLTNNHISVIGASLFRNNSNLNSLHLSQNSINTVEPGAFEGKNITSFFFEHNNLTGPLKLASFENVYSRTIDLSGGKITSLETEAFRKSHIHSLNLSSNVIDSISNTTFRSLNYLKSLDLSNNNISSINFITTEFNDLVMLDVRNNSLTQISVNALQNLTLLENLDLSFNYISELQPQSFKDLEKLKTLDLKSNNLSNSLEANTFQGLKALPDLQLVFTKIPSFEDDAFSGLDSLRILNTSHGVLASIGYNTFNNTGSLKILDLSYNLLEEFLINTTSIPLLEELYLNNNKIRSVTNNSFFGLVHLVALDLNNNNIVTFGSTVFRNLPNMHTLYLSSNCIRKQFTFENVISTAMKQLDLSSCQIENANTIFICKIQNLEWLNLSANEITFIDKFTFQNMPDLLWLDLSFNQISYIQPGSFLRTNRINLLNLHGNEIPALQFGVLDGLKELRELNLSSNALHSFELSMLHNFPRYINTIALDDNAIEDFNFIQFSGTTIRLITIGGNPISCNVFVSLKKNRILGIKITAETLNYHSENVDGIRCISDPKFNKSLKYYKSETNVKSDSDTFTEIGVVSTNKVQESVIYNLTNVLEAIDKHIVISINKLSNTMEHVINNITKSHTTVIDAELVTPNSKNPVVNDATLTNFQLQENLKEPNKERYTMLVELKTMFQNLINTKADNNIVLYVIAICLTIIVIILMLFVYNFINPRNRISRSNILYKGSQPITNFIEME